MTTHCMAKRQPDGSFGCLACKRRWDADEEVQCEAEYEFVEGIPPKYIGVDLAKPGSDTTAISWPAGHPPTLAEFVVLAGYELKPYQVQLLRMLDEQIRNGRTQRR